MHVTKPTLKALKTGGNLILSRLRKSLQFHSRTQLTRHEPQRWQRKKTAAADADVSPTATNQTESNHTNNTTNTSRRRVRRRGRLPRRNPPAGGWRVPHSSRHRAASGRRFSPFKVGPPSPLPGLRVSIPKHPWVTSFLLPFC